ncbi:MAG: DNA-directed RNA polymerase subunit alpha [Thermoanaerobaculia bacterium]|nr:DNA-directed RNA polymerase subunit alpha [Thermoanaerobaculia bacterium]
MWKGFQRPQRVEFDPDTITPEYGNFTAQPFERGFATTIGNAMRRCLLSSIEGAATTAVQIEGVLHEFASIPGVVEDVTDIILSLKQVPLVLHGEESRYLTLDVEGPAEVTAGDFSSDPQVEIVDEDVHIATVNEEGHLKLQARVDWGRGYVSAEENFDESLGIGWIPVDSVHSPVKRVSYSVGKARLGRSTDYERLELEVRTNGTVSPQDAVSLAAQLLSEHLTLFMVSEKRMPEIEEIEEPEEPSELEKKLEKSIDELALSVRSINTLKNANIHTLRDLVTRTEREVLEAKGFGKKSMEELQEALDETELELGMDVEESVSA